MDVRRWPCGRTFKGCLHVRRKVVRTYDHRVSGRTSIGALNDEEWKVNEPFSKSCTNSILLCRVLFVYSSRLRWKAVHFRLSKCYPTLCSCVILLLVLWSIITLRNRTRAQKNFCALVCKSACGDYSLSSSNFIISQAALATLVPGPKMAATPA